MPSPSTRPGSSSRPRQRPAAWPQADHPARPTTRWTARLLIGLSLLGLLVTGYLTWLHLTGSGAFCTGLGGCDLVQGSRYAYVAGVPIAYLGLGMYLALATLALWRGRGGPAWTGLALFGISLTGILFSLYLTWVELFVLGAICPWCVTSALVVVGIGIVSARDIGLWA